MRVPALALLGVAALGCGHVSAVRPVPKGKLQVEAAAGGPAAWISPVPLPLPLSTAGARYGLGERFDVGGHLHLTALTFRVLGLDAGSTYLALEQSGLRPAVSVSGRIYGFANVTDGARAYLEASGCASYLLGERATSYLSVTGLVQLAGGGPVFSLAAGEQVSLGHWGLQLELRWYGPNVAAAPVAVNWLSVFGLGAWGLVLGASYQL